MKYKHGKYKGAEFATSLAGCTALLRDAPDDPGYVLVQFDYMLVQGVAQRPGKGIDEQLPYCFGWHRFPESVFELERTTGHSLDCNCMECRPEPHSLDQLRRRF